MNQKMRMLLLWFAIIPLGLPAQGISDIIEGLKSISSFTSEAKVSITAPTDGEETSYDIMLYANANAPSDSLLGCRYIVKYSQTSPDSSKWGFGAYIGDTLYRYDGLRFHEYSEAAGTLSASVVNGTMFSELLPSRIIENLSKTDSLIDISFKIEKEGPDRINLTILKTVADQPVECEEYKFTIPGYSPLYYKRTSGLGTLTEMTMSASYLPSSTSLKSSQIDRYSVEKMFPEILSRFTSDNLSPESFVGYRLPPFTLPDTQGGRYSFSPGSYTIIALIDDSDDQNDLEQAADAIRHATSRHPSGGSIDIINIILSRYTDAVRASRAPSGHEHTLLNGNSVARTLGAKDFPLILLVDQNGVVKEVSSGVNKDIDSIVIEMLNNITFE